MSKPKILSETPISIAEVKDELAKIKKRDGEAINFRVGKTEEYVQLFSLEDKKEKELVKKIEEIGIARFKKEHIIKLVDLMPKNAEEVKIVLQGYTVTVTPENMKKIADIING